MGCFSGIIRTVMFIFNIACLIVGVAILALGSFAYVEMKVYATSYLTFPIILIVVGVFVSLVSFLGCCGAMRSNKCMLMTYAIILLVLLVVQLAGGIYGLVTVKGNGEYSDFKKDVIDELVKVFKGYDENEASTTLIDNLQLVYKCCGINSKEDYLILLTRPYPSSCCGKKNPEVCAINEINDVGCGTQFFQTIEKYIRIISIVVICICAVELLAALLAIYISRKK